MWHLNISSAISYKTLHRFPNYGSLTLYKCSLIPRHSFSLASCTAFVSSSAPVLTMQDFLIHIHEITNFPWWAVIGLTTLSFRCVLFPLMVHQNQVVARLENIKTEMAKIKGDLAKEVTIASRLYNWDFKTSRGIFYKNMQNQYQKLIIRDNCHPFKTVAIVFFQIPVWVCLSVSLRNLSLMLPHHDPGTKQAFYQLKQEGILCFLDMTVPDSFLIPVLVFIVNISLIEMHSLKKIMPNSLLEKLILNGSRCAAVFMACIAAFTPSCVSFYWLCSCTLGLVQNSVLLIPKLRRLLKIPCTSSESTMPFHDIINNFKLKFISNNK